MLSLDVRMRCVCTRICLHIAQSTVAAAAATTVTVTVIAMLSYELCEILSTHSFGIGSFTMISILVIKH